MSGWTWANWVLAGLLLLLTLVRIADDGKPKTGTHQAGWAVADLMTWGILLYNCGPWVTP